MLFGEDYIVITELAIHKSFMVPTYVQNQGMTRKKIVKRSKVLANRKKVFFLAFARGLRKNRKLLQTTVALAHLLSWPFGGKTKPFNFDILLSGSYEWIMNFYFVEQC